MEHRWWWRSNYGWLFKGVPGLVENDAPPGKAEKITIQTADLNVPRGGGRNLRNR